MLRVCPHCLSLVTSVFCAECGARLEPSLPKPRLVLRVGWSKSKDYDEIVSSLSQEEGYSFREEGEDIYHEVPLSDLDDARRILMEHSRVLKWRDTWLRAPGRKDELLAVASPPGSCFMEGLFEGHFPCEASGGCLYGHGLFAPDRDPQLVAAYDELRQVERFWAMEALAWEVLEHGTLLVCPKFQDLVARVSAEMEESPHDAELWPFAAMMVQQAHQRQIPLERPSHEGRLEGWETGSALLHGEPTAPPVVSGGRVLYSTVEGTFAGEDTLLAAPSTVLSAMPTPWGGIALLESEGESLLVRYGGTVASFALGCRVFAFDEEWRRFACHDGSSLKYGRVLWHEDGALFMVTVSGPVPMPQRMWVSDGAVMVLFGDGSSMMWRAGSEEEGVEDGVALTQAGPWRRETGGWIVVTPHGRRIRMLRRMEHVVPMVGGRGVWIQSGPYYLGFGEDGSLLAHGHAPEGDVMVHPQTVSWLDGHKLRYLFRPAPFLEAPSPKRVVWAEPMVELDDSRALVFGALVEYAQEVGEGWGASFREIVAQARPDIRAELEGLISAVPLLQRALEGEDVAIGRVVLPG